MEDGIKEVEKDMKKIEKEVEKGVSNRWKQPGRMEVFLVLVYLFSWYLFNDMFNLISIEGLGTMGNFFNGVIIAVSIPFFLSFIVMISVLVTFVVRSTFDTASHRNLNIFVGVWILFGAILMVVSMVLMLQDLGPAYQVQWLSVFTKNRIYHLGVFLFQIPGIIYFALFG